MALVAEFIVEPFIPGNPGEHVTSALAAAEGQGASLEVGPFGNLMRGDDEVIFRAVDAALRAALAKGATRVAVQLAVDTPE